MNAPTLLATSARGESFAGVTYHIDGELVPVLAVDLGNVPVYFEHFLILVNPPADECQCATAGALV